MNWIDQIWSVLSTEGILGNSAAAWIAALVTALFGGVFITYLCRFLADRARHLANRHQSAIGTYLAIVISSVNPLLVLIFAIYCGSLFLTLPERFDRFLHGAFTVAIFIQIGLWGSGLSDLILRYLEAGLSDSVKKTAHGVMLVITRTVIWAAVMMLALDNLGIDITTLVAGLGIGGIAIALATQSVLGDVLASLSIVMDRPFEVGDFVSVGEHSGTVEHIGIKTTRIRSLSGEQLVFSNADILKQLIKNFKRLNERRVLFKIGVTYDTAFEKVAQIPGIIERLITQQGQTRFDRAHFVGFGDSSLDYEVVYFVENREYKTMCDIHQAVLLGIMQEFEKIGVDFAFPSRTVYLRQEQAANSS